MNDVTVILDAVNRGDTGATDELLATVYDELRSLAAAKISRERAGYTLQPTALVNEAYLRLFDVGNSDESSEQKVSIGWQSRRHFFGAAAEAMRRILIDRARARDAVKRGGDNQRVDCELNEIEVPAESIDILALDEALAKLEREDSQKAEVVKLRYFAGLTIEQTAQALEVSEPTVKRYWFYARAWLRREMEGDADDGVSANS